MKTTFLLLALLSGSLFLQGIQQTVNAQTDSTLVAVDDYIYANAGVLIIDVLANDIFDGAVSVVTLDCGPTYGIAELSPSGGIIYLFNTGAILNDSFCYVICNAGSVCDTAMVYIYTDTIAPPPNPIAYNDYVQLMAGTLAVFSPLANDIVSGVGISITATTLPMNGTLAQSGNSFTYTPNAGFTGEDLFTYTVCNSSGACSSATVYLFVEDTGTGGSVDAIDDTFYTYTDEPIVIDLLGNDIWPPAAVINIVSTSDPENGTLTPGDVAFYYTPNPGFTGIDQFSYVLCSGNTPIECDSALVTIYVMPMDSDTTVVTPCMWGCVWPGDADNNGIANNFDILAIGLGYDLSGPARTDASLNWVGQYTDDWADYIGVIDSTIVGGGTIGFFNAKYADCNGNGLISAEDTLAVSVNYGLVHGKTGSDADEDAPLLYFNLPTVVQEDTWVSADILLGNADVAINNIHGLAFSFEIDSALVDAASVSFTFDSDSWLGAESNLKFSKQLAGGQTDVAYTRTDHNNVSGYGKIGTVHFFVIDNIDGKNESDVPLLQLSASNAVTVNAQGILSQLNTATATADIATGIEPNNPNTSTTISLYPNPANNSFTVFSSNTPIEQLNIRNISGQIVYSTVVGNTTGSVEVNTHTFTPGMYLVQAQTKNGVVTQKIQIVR